MFICCREMLNFAPASAQPETAFSACAPSRQTGLPPCQTTPGGTAHLQEWELIWNNCAGKGFLTDFRTDCHGNRQPQD